MFPQDVYICRVLSFAKLYLDVGVSYNLGSISTISV